uniref:Triosephosphate isomerase n=1 Tax=Timspurckia oligopyrenoides TaxID=708627 RepID=A0A7S0ZI50_9RHOD|mmetsp:Transcript_5944/g.10553  ORF Transcript_5944/g.10553 Transcript_5944/m.10553 type:complete len:254 (+) Transcript_5944:94-855(+)|eukprot:CAMPEP_0182443408 /NCGR_PEP_ID=MMETSP1172-20130603/2149_1 /TAXON_ID=708627 /ORGANISM="Timspurckia oligopyrenoides, Strain CCMP3278" /LENGTH=253 /DNA_ID=CAMNT_0024638673 /DNA_START=54 /DNA_END=815 /DNA_ORIENTATION=-
MGRKFCVGGNWKCNGTKASIEKLCKDLEGDAIDSSKVEVVCFPSFLYADYARGLLRKDFEMGVQNCWIGKGGAFTGEVAADMIVDCGFGWVCLGHSERRHLPQLKETDADIATKAKYCLGLGLKVMYCIGELLEEREAGQTDAVNERQLKALADTITDWSNVVIAYEPVWAIGTGKVATPAQAQEVHANIRKWLAANVSAEVAESTRILYGGSVAAGNCDELSKMADIDGFLVGGASLKKDFLTIVASYKGKE